MLCGTPRALGGSSRSVPRRSKAAPRVSDRSPKELNRRANSSAVRLAREEPGHGVLVRLVMRSAAKHVSPWEVLNHLLHGAGLGVFLALSLIVGNGTMFKVIAASAFPKLAVLGFVAGLASFIAVGSAIFIMTAMEKS
jgi:hypothetical protein